MQIFTLPEISASETQEDCFSQLKPREWKVLLLLVDDFSNQDIMLALNLQRREILTLKSSISFKLNLKDPKKLLQFCRSNRDFILSRYNIGRM
ncbi:LuxR C-terminal-related transcriptional regulator [Dyadobacter luticola]|uniref:HTH luxR-type domain-containing protein n=1 Tax=Dyadobacter luticola TaxID=1979387 RepID=A0A5R9KPM1_9BACT|nr:LuxR C-terminal-related transcriptional regulator [Dyadobacter luticola]TLU98172.1 hypothetical protein FEN17_25690 [Dyadobacter luticola]